MSGVRTVPRAEISREARSFARANEQGSVVPFSRAEISTLERPAHLRASERGPFVPFFTVPRAETSTPERPAHFPVRANERGPFCSVFTVPLLVCSHCSGEGK